MFSSYSSEGMSGSLSTPLKSDARTASGQTSAREERALLLLPAPNDKFADCHLSSTEFPSSPEVEQFVREQVDLLREERYEADMYSRIVNILNRLSQVAFSMVYPSDQNVTESNSMTPPQRALVFMASPTKPPPKDIFGVRLKPDIVGSFSTLGSLHTALEASQSNDVPHALPQKHSGSRVVAPPWSQLETTIEAKPRGTSASSQIHQYADSLLRYRPDKTKALCFTSNQLGYTFYAVDACGAECSTMFDWDTDISMLFRFVYSIYCPPTHDNTLTSMEDSSHVSSKWKVGFDRHTYAVSPVFARRGEGRRTWIAIGHDVAPTESSGIASRIVKDNWRDNHRRFEEGSLLEKMHKNGFIPGIVRSIAHGALPGLTIGEPQHTRTKHRLIMGSTGARLSSCRSILHFLRVMYDVLEAHQHAVESGVLHRDLSWYNILCLPRHHVEGPELERPCIASIMGENDPRSSCLLTDFDNAAEVLPQATDTPDNELTHRTGTPMFIASDISGGVEIYLRIVPRPVVVEKYHLCGDAFQKYLDTYGTESYDTFNHLLASIADNSSPEEEPSEPVIHQPFHDVESVFWTIVWFLLRASPENHPDTWTAQYQRVCNAMLQHQIGEDFLGGRLFLREYNVEQWKRVLHPECHDLAGMLSDMGMYLSIKWLRYPSTPKFHAHEALKRLLLKEIVRMTQERKEIVIKGPRSMTAQNRHGVSSFLASSSRSSFLATATSTPREPSNATQSGSSSHKRKRPASADIGPPIHKKPRRKSAKPSDADELEMTVEKWLQIFKDDEKWFR